MEKSVVLTTFLALCFSDTEEIKGIVSDLQTKKENTLQNLKHFPLFLFYKIVLFSTMYKVEFYY